MATLSLVPGSLVPQGKGLVIEQTTYSRSGTSKQIREVITDATVAEAVRAIDTGHDPAMRKGLLGALKFTIFLMSLRKKGIVMVAIDDSDFGEVYQAQKSLVITSAKPGLSPELARFAQSSIDALARGEVISVESYRAARTPHFEPAQELREVAQAHRNGLLGLAGVL